jgi:hypothetical protein
LVAQRGLGGHRDPVKAVCVAADRRDVQAGRDASICRHIVPRDPEIIMSDHVKVSEQRKEERRAGAVDSTKDQAPSKDSLQHVQATAGRSEIIAVATDIQAARHSVASGPATSTSSTPDCGELTQKQDGLPPTSLTTTAPPGSPQTAAETPSSAGSAPRDHLIDGLTAAAGTKNTSAREAARKSLELARGRPGLIVPGTESAKDLIRDLCALTSYEAAARAATAAAKAVGGNSQMVVGSDEFTTATSSDEIIKELSDNSKIKLYSSIEVKVDRPDRGGFGLSLRESLIIEDPEPGPYRRSTRVRAGV